MKRHPIILALCGLLFARTALGQTSVDQAREHYQDTFDIFASGAGRSLQILVAGPSPLSAGTYQCGQTPPQARMAYLGRGAQTATEAQTCSVTLTEVGTSPDRPVTGTFEATSVDASGATTVLTDGSFGLAKTQ